MLAPMWNPPEKPPEVIRFALPGQTEPHRLMRATLDEVDGVTGAVQSSLPELQPSMNWIHQGYAEADAMAFLQLSEEWWAQDSEFNWTIRDPDNAVLGMCGLMRRLGPGSLEVGYWVRTDATGKGLATAVTKSLISLGLAASGVQTVFLRHAKSNSASARVAEKAGMSLLGEHTHPSTIDPDADAPVWAIGDLGFRPESLPTIY